MIDLEDRLRRARPTTAELDRMWGPAERLVMLERVRSSTRNPRRRWIAGAVAAAGAAAALVVPALSTPIPASAADLRSLSAAVAAHGSSYPPGGWLHERSNTVQRNSDEPGVGATVDRETWTGWNGKVFLVEREPATGRTTYEVIPAPRHPSYENPTLQFARTLPHTARGILGYLQPRVEGSSSHDEAMYAALVDLASSHMLPPTTLAAVFDALATLDRVSTTHSRAAGRPAIVISYEEPRTRFRESLIVDRSSGEVLSLRQTSQLHTYVSTTTQAQSLDHLPDSVRSEFRAHQPGVDYPATP
ncbi:hypothetical protein D9V37_16610 [Nocardioides mangrovicus]|uniref:CU044_5270 family protein n=1 Tax=Nocardioides mangrovicus TaxID=2478913 RepID=A0A3L8P067_9ACTN|nr:hypothetical protein [Nocardioides mangrovicus]RLV47758.1 hypothetical protein D9V37_16610 [Nocardioides mangrovicus]